MAEPKHEEPGSETPATENKGELPAVEAPPLSPASEAPQPALDAPTATPTADAPAATPTTETVAVPTADAAPKRLYLKPQHKRQALAAAAVALVAGFGAVVGALAGSAWSPPPKHDVAGLQERKAMQQSIAHGLQERTAMQRSIAQLSKQVALLKADLEKANKAASAQIASISARLDAPATPEITGSIAQAPEAAPVPIPRPAPRVAAAESRPTVVLGWSIRGARNGFAYVQSHGDVFQVVPGVPLPGLGPVRSIRRQDGHWVVVTPRGIIVSQRDRRSFE